MSALQFPDRALTERLFGVVSDWYQDHEVVMYCWKTEVPIYYAQLKVQQDDLGHYPALNPTRHLLSEEALWLKACDMTFRRLETAQEEGHFEPQRRAGLPCHPPSAAEGLARYIRTLW